MELKNYMQDGANHQAKAVLAYLQENDGIGESWNDKLNCYDARIEISRWENGREQGYIVSLRNSFHEQLNIAFFEHRNSDSICAVEWVQNSMNSITIDTAKFGNIYKNKYDVSHEVEYGFAVLMADWIWDRLIDHWTKTNKKGDK